MKTVKSLIKRLMGKRNNFRIIFSGKICKIVNKGSNPNIFKKIKYFFKVKIYKNSSNKSNLYKLCQKIELTDMDKNDIFYYSLDIYKTIQIENRSIDNFTINYKKILDNSLLDLKENIKENKKDENFYKREIRTIEAIELLINRIVKKLEDQNANTDIINNIKNIKDKRASNFKEALQRILFFNQLLWQTSHRLNGLGRLDIILEKYFENDIKQGILTQAEAKKMIKEFLIVLHKYYTFKSNSLLGDTGQIIELGGKDIDGKYKYNELTYIFIELMEELKLPDPKVLLRVSSNMPRELMEKSLKCIQTGIGCPLFANDDIIIEHLIQFGYDKEDAYQYGTSACWEPYIVGKAFDQNNIKSVVFIRPFEILLQNEDVSKIQNLEELLQLYKQYLKQYLEEFIKKAEKIKWQEDPLLSLFIDNCIQENKDISIGGAKYNHYGFTGVGLANLVNSILNIDKLVLKNKEITFTQLNEIRKNNFEHHEELLKKLKSQTVKYGTDNEEAIKLSNTIIEFATEILKEYTNPLGGSYKFGLSAPSYIDESTEFPASIDGRKKGEPFAVHISSDTSNAYTELMQFAANLNYGENRFNGNVVDFIVSPNFIKDNFEKFVDFLMLSVKNGFFEMQMNVVSSATLIEARNNPDKFPNLIVRVWGFSAYFNDLPENYKNNLIERALKSEGNSY